MASSNVATDAVAKALLGPVLMGDVAQVAIWGILVSHAGHTISSSSWKGFSTLLRSTVYLVLLLVTFSASLSINDFWFYGTSTANGDLNRILRGSLLEALGPVVIGATAVIVQCVLLVRASKVMERLKWVYISAMGSTIVVEVLACALVQFYQLDYYKTPVDNTFAFPSLTFANALWVWMVVQAGVDIIISATYLIILRRRLSSYSHSYLRLIVTVALQSALLTTVLAVVTAIVVIVFDGAYNPMTEDIYLAFLVPQPPLYVLSLFMVLSIPEKSRQQDRDANVYLVTHLDPESLPLPNLETAEVKALHGSATLEDGWGARSVRSER